MPKFKVTIEKPTGIYGGTDRPLNPFHIRDIFDRSLYHRVLVREFEFEADSQAHALRLYEEAQKAGIPNVQGFRLRSIEEL